MRLTSHYRIGQIASTVLVGSLIITVSASAGSAQQPRSQVRQQCDARPDHIHELEQSLQRHITQQFRARYKARWGYFPTPDTAAGAALYPDGPYRELVRNLQSREEVLQDRLATERAAADDTERLTEQLRKVRQSLAEAATIQPEELKERTSWLGSEIETATRALNGLLQKEAAQEVSRLRINLCLVCDNTNQVVLPAKDIIDRTLVRLREHPSDPMPARLRQVAPPHLAQTGALADVRTAVLVYDLSSVEGAGSVCIWLITRRGIEAAATIPLPAFQLSAFLQDRLGVRTRAASRMPRPKTGRTNRVAVPPEVAEQIPAGRAELPDAQEDMTAGLAHAGQILLPSPVRDALLRSRPERVLILPVADLSTIPFAALPVSDARALIDVAELVILTDTDPLFVPQWPPRFERGAPALVVGDPYLAGDPNWEFTPLPEARAEAVHAGEVLGAHSIVGTAAARQSIRSELANKRRALKLVYFATHGIADAVNPMDGSFLALSGGHLYARDIKEVRLEQHPLVVMSACQTGLGKVFEGGTFGLTRAWHFAGASQVVMSLWNVDDAATRDLMTNFLNHYEHGARAETALRLAMIETRARYAHPLLWAGFAVSMGSQKDYRDR